MKKCSFTLLSFLLLSVASFPQENYFGVKLGLSSNYMPFVKQGEKTTSHKTGFNVGVVNYFQAGPNFAIQSIFQAAMRGGQLNEVDFTTWHFEVPLNFLLTDGGFFIGGGPYISFGIGGHSRGENLEPGNDVDIYADEKKPDFIFRQPEAGLNAVIGYNFAKGFSMQANFAQSINSLNTGPNGYKVRPHSLGFAVAYLFGKCR